jgi:glutaminyl-peptide cyclotransferase
MSMRIVAALLLLVAALPAAAAPQLAWHLVREYPHDPAAFTEGLVFDHQGHLIESSGGYGNSELAIRDLASGRKLKSVAVPPRDFGEGTALVGDRIIQLTWREGHAYVYDTALKALAQFLYSGEGWGLTWDGRRLIQSDGSPNLYFVDPQTFATLGHVSVHDGAAEVDQINELEYVQGRVYANLWQTDRIIVIDPASGSVLGWLDMAELQTRFPKPPEWDPSDDVLNGIAWNPANGHFYVTGKRWPKLFEITIDGP